jgi:hypothetical protein
VPGTFVLYMRVLKNVLNKRPSNNISKLTLLLCSAAFYNGVATSYLEKMEEAQAFFAIVHVAPIDKFQQHSSKNSLFPFLF